MLNNIFWHRVFVSEVPMLLGGVGVVEEEASVEHCLDLVDGSSYFDPLTIRRNLPYVLRDTLIETYYK